MPRDHVLTAIDALYDAVLDDEGFGSALDLICRATSSEGFNIFLLDRQSGSVPLNVSRGIPDDVLRDYNAHYVMVDPGIQFFLKNPGLPFYYNALHTAESEIDRSEYYDWLQGAGGARYYLAQTLEIDRRVSMIATAQRGRRVGHAQSADIERLARIGPHIQRTMRLNLLIGDLNSRLAAAYDALDCLDHGVCLLSSGGRIVFANRVARDFSQSRDVVWLGRERLETDTRSGKASLDGAIGAACSPLDALPRSGSVRLEKRDGRPLIVHVIALSDRVRGRLVGAPSVLVLIHDPDRKRGMTASDLGAVFELTVTEGEIAVALGEGLTPGEICAVRGIGLNTLKTHRRRIFEKLGVASQSALVRLLTGF